jgi:signal transduction histidine kinase
MRSLLGRERPPASARLSDASSAGRTIRGVIPPAAPRPEDEPDRPEDDDASPRRIYGPAVREQSTCRTRFWPSPAEFGWPAVLALWVQADVWGPPPIAFGHVVGPRPVESLLYALTSLALAWRRRAPVTVLAVVVTADTSYYLVFGAPQGLGSLLPLLFALYGVGRWSRPANGAVAALLGLLGLMAHESLDPQFVLDGSTALYWLALSVAWPMGYAFRRRAVESEVLAEQARLLTAERDRRAREAVEAERGRIARELHDVVGHGLSVVVLQLVAAIGILDKGDATSARERLLGVEHSARDALAEMRRLLDLLHEDEGGSLAPRPGLADLERLVADTRAAGADVVLRRQGEPRDLPPGMDLALFRVAQEALTNVLKHARPPRAEVCLCHAPGAVQLDVRDHGEVAAADNPAGRGLTGMRERVGLYGGDIDVGPVAEGGYRVRARLPVPP